jgi:hypothetical protein
MVGDVPQDISLTQSEQAELLQTILNSGIQLRTYAGGIQYNWILASITCSLVGIDYSCDLEDLSPSYNPYDPNKSTLKKVFEISGAQFLRFVNESSSSSAACYTRIGGCSIGETAVSCWPTGGHYGVEACTCCPDGAGEKQSATLELISKPSATQ